jgi:hypothetical protein
MDLAVVAGETKLQKSFMMKLKYNQVVAIISASVSWLMLVRWVAGCPSLSRIRPQK